jgi:hypothetical protein
MQCALLCKLTDFEQHCKYVCKFTNHMRLPAECVQSC